MIAVAPNGARKTSSDHARLPISPAELAQTATDCVEAGACMLHLHVRDERLEHSLEAQRYRDATAAIRAEVGDELIIQITTEAVGRYSREQQIQTVRETRPEAVSLAIREICPAGSDDSHSAEFFEFLELEHISPQFILYDAADILRLNDMLSRGLLGTEKLSVLLVLGRYIDDQQSNPDEIVGLLSKLPKVRSWSLCAFGASEALCMREAVQLGGHCRVGFENNLLMPDGSLAADNAALVRVVADGIRSSGHEVATAREARDLLGMNR